MRLTALTLAAVALAGIAPAQAASLPTDGSWAHFSVDGNLPPYALNWIDDNAEPLSFEFTVAAGYQATLTVLDGGFTGDRFFVYNNGDLLGQTSQSPNGDSAGAITFDLDEALANPDFSRGVFTLGAGSHNVTGWLSQSTSDAFGPLNATLGGVKLTVSPVPEPASVALLLAGLGLIGLALRGRVKTD